MSKKHHFTDEDDPEVSIHLALAANCTNALSILQWIKTNELYSPEQLSTLYSLSYIDSYLDRNNLRPKKEKRMTNTDIVLYGEDETPRQQKFIQEYFSADHLSNEEYLEFQVLATRYTGGETVRVDPYLSSKLADGREILQPIWLWGLFCYPKERVDINSGEMVPKVGVVFRMGDKAGPTDKFLSFEAESANNFVKRSILPMIKRGMLTVGDWEMGIPIAVWAIPLTTGRTFRFRLLSPKEV